MESSSSDEEDSQLPFWNNWLPPSNSPSNQSDSNNHKKITKFSNRSLFSTKTVKCGNWIPPVNFFNQDAKIKTKIKLDRNVYDTEQTRKKSKKTSDDDAHEGREESIKTDCDNFSNIINMESNWNKITQLHDVTGFNDGDLIWGVVNLGVFVHIKLWVNQYGNICGTADGRISKLGYAETTFISVTNAELLRKILGLSQAQWASLCETVQETKSTLKFDAFEDFNVTGKTALEKLWFFLCKRRHFLPSQFMLVKLSGAVKCLRNFKIIPKVVVQEIKST